MNVTNVYKPAVAGFSSDQLHADN